MNQRYLSWAEIDLDAVAFDIQGFKRYVGDRVLLGAVVKANAYGHGAVEMARACLQNGADWAIVNRSNEGVELRQAGITAPTLVLGHTMADEAERIVAWDLRPTVSNAAQIEALSTAAARRGTRVPVHVKLDTGLSRQGVMPGEAADFVGLVARTPHVALEGLYSHFAVADENSPDAVAFTRRQFETFLAVREDLRRAGFEIPICHVANTAATLNDPAMHLDLVRVGSGITGMYPSEETLKTIPLKPVLSLKSHVGRVATLPPGASIGYGRTFTAAAPVKIALVPVGYADGYRRSLSNRGVVLIHGRRAQVVGRISMDQCTVDVTHIPDVAVDDEVVLIGAQGGDALSADEVADLAGTVAAELTSALPARLPRVYLRGGEVVAVRDLVAG